MEQQDKPDLSGLAPEVELPKLTPALQPADLGQGCVARYLGSETRDSKNYGREQKLHSFELGSGFARSRFALWGNVQLDLKLRQVPKTGIVILQYLGKDEGERAQHKWSVRQFRGTVKQLQEVAVQYEQGSRAVAESIAYVERKMDGQSEVDDDLPF